MRTTARIECFALAAASMLAGCDRATDMVRGIDPDGIGTIAELLSTAHSPSYFIAENISVRGRITANDHYGEFYKTLVIEDESGALSIAVDHERLSPRYPRGGLLTVACNGLTLTSYGGKYVLGMPGDGSGPGRIPGEELDHYLFVDHKDIMPRLPIRITIPEIGAPYIDRYVRLDDVGFTEPGPWCEIDADGIPQTTEHTLADAAGNTITVRMPGTCLYARDLLPLGRGTVCGLVDRFNGRYSLRIIYREFAYFTGATPPTACLSTGECSTPIPTK